MKAPLLVHNNNSFLALKNGINNEKFDDSIVDFIDDVLIHEKFDILIIPFSLSENYLEFVGLELAYHIRLTKELEDLRFVPIIFFGEETPYLISKLSWLGRILYTDGIYIAKENKIKELSEKDLKGTTEEKVREQIAVPPPSNYSSHHSIANEWSIIRWAKYLGIDGNETFKPLIEKISSSLYYKYLLNKFPIEQVTKGQLQIESEGKILLIDDEWEKGWGDIFKEFFKNSRSIKFSVLEVDYSKLDQNEIINHSKSKINEFKTDMVILDMRLHEVDFSDKTNIDDYTSSKLLKIIKEEINPGIQVIIFTASNKVWNLQRLEELGADGFIIKESPEFNRDSKFTRENIKSFKKTIEKSLDKKYLKKLFLQKKLIVSKLNEFKREKELNKDFCNEINRLVDLSFGLLVKGQTEGLISSFLLLFNVIEIIANEFINEKHPIETGKKFLYEFYNGSPVNYYKWEKDHYVSKGKLKRDSRSFQLSTNIKIINYAKENTKMEDSNIYAIEKLTGLRNDFIHQNLINGEAVKIEKQDVVELFNFVYELITKMSFE